MKLVNHKNYKTQINTRKVN